VGQRHDVYGNVVPIFAKRISSNEPLTVCGDGSQTRDFVNVRDVAQANFLAATASRASGTYNIGSGVATSINQLIEFMGSDDVIYEKRRPGDVLHSVADISKAHGELGYVPSVNLQDGIRKYLEWFNKDQTMGQGDAG
jgi:nucleoside-diphosphate-sugar epimerase